MPATAVGRSVCKGGGADADFEEIGFIESDREVGRGEAEGELESEDSGVADPLLEADDTVAVWTGAIVHILRACASSISEMSASMLVETVETSVCDVFILFAECGSVHSVPLAAMLLASVAPSVAREPGVPRAHTPLRAPSSGEIDLGRMRRGGLGGLSVVG